jgi:DnaJ-domain-containing protein 1
MPKKGFLDGYKTYNTRKGFGNAKQWKNAFQQRMSKEDAEEILSKQHSTPHEILGVSPHASPATIKAAFRKLIKEWHPDRNQHRIEEAEAQSKKILAAYTVLSPK